MTEDFYVGYSPKAPARLARRVAWTAAGIVFAGLAAGAVLLLNQPSFADSKFEFGVVREYTGTIEEWPVAMLRTSARNFLLVAPGKHGLAVAGYQGKSVRLSGSLIERGADRMLEVPQESVHEIAPLALASSSAPVRLGRVTLRGEIVDGKCYLGVMNPGNGKVHRDCAARCISGGAPPAFVVMDSRGETHLLLLVGADGRALHREVLPFVAEPLEVSGELIRADSVLVLQADPAQFRRL